MYIHYKTGCSTDRCKCKIRNSQCGPGCKCIGCKNLPVEAVGPSDEHSDSAVSSDDSESTASDLEHEVDQLMADVFGTTGSSDEDT